MNKIIAVFDGFNFSDILLQKVISIALINNCMISGIYLEDLNNKIPQISADHSQNNFCGKVFVNDSDDRASALSRFEKACTTAGIHFKVHRDSDVAIHELLSESRYADLLIIAGSCEFSRNKESLTPHYLKNLFYRAECPVLLVPGKLHVIEGVSWLYDGSPGCLQALKMLGYLLPFFHRLPLEVLIYGAFPAGNNLPCCHFIEELYIDHASDVTFRNFIGHSSSKLFSYLRGHFGRNLLLSWASRPLDVVSEINNGMAGQLLVNTEWPLLIVKQ
ncbi:universal stress protein [Chitinophaga sancti]|uniref:universal stress protein n=1 Tax=Chitinophaga sancti TaxID=1004 RepID=UPI002A74CF77|nr:universal stress protein [Chitinophaga sancti]WPQ60441.1 universal stress protein [Chitinophaga sancti]